MVGLLGFLGQVWRQQAIREGFATLRRDWIGLRLNGRTKPFGLPREDERTYLASAEVVSTNAARQPKAGMLGEDVTTVLPGLTPESENVPSASVADSGPPPGTNTRAAADLRGPARRGPVRSISGAAGGGLRGSCAFPIEPHPIGDVRYETGLANRDSVARARPIRWTESGMHHQVGF